MSDAPWLRSVPMADESSDEDVANPYRRGLLVDGWWCECLPSLPATPTT